VFAEVLRNRGRTGMNREEIIERLYQLIAQCELLKSDQARLTIISTLISIYFDASIRKQAGMSGVRWRKTKDLIAEMLDTLTKNIDTLRMSIHADIKLALKEEEKKATAETKADKELKFLAALQGKTIADIQKTTEKGQDGQLIFSVLASGTNVTLDNKYAWVHGNLWSFIKRSREQLWINLKSIPHRTPAYDKRLLDIKEMLKLLREAFKYYDKLGDRAIQADINTTIISLIYHEYDEKFDELTHKEKSEDNNNTNNKEQEKDKTEKNGTQNEQQKEEEKINIIY